ncbi:unnamed protein product [Cuscuta europaea]|uniref:Uncharacterized protein n=1 Tax=Cuscuta europaea TaxID=41803 RepID=A0A9P0ZXP8_CUSEU|nr:unnamed protein product [Cuscuta europaea]
MVGKEIAGVGRTVLHVRDKGRNCSCCVAGLVAATYRYLSTARRPEEVRNWTPMWIDGLHAIESELEDALVKFSLEINTYFFLFGFSCLCIRLRDDRVWR